MFRPQARGVVDAVCALHDANRGEAITKEACVGLILAFAAAAMCVLREWGPIRRARCRQHDDPHERLLPKPPN